jgi:hypothetical protein
LLIRRQLTLWLPLLLLLLLLPHLCLIWQPSSQRGEEGNCATYGACSA